MVLAIAFVGTLASCNSFEREAKEQMEKTMKELAKNPDTFKITDVETMFSNDSTCVLHFKTKGQNGFGGWSAGNYEYVYIKSKNIKENIYETYETVINLEEKGNKGKSVYTLAKELYESYRDNINNRDYKDSEIMKSLSGKGWDNETKECRAYMIHSACEIATLPGIGGRKVNGENNEKDDWK